MNYLTLGAALLAALLALPAHAGCGWDNFKFGRLAQQYWLQKRGVYIKSIVDASWQCGKGSDCRAWVNAQCNR